MAGALVLDSFALLSFLRDARGADMIAYLLDQAQEREQPLHMTEVNYAEVQYIIRRKHGERAWRLVARDLTALPIEFHPADRPLADQAAEFKTRFRLSLADAFAAALAKLRDAELVTGDEEFRPLEREIRIRWLK